MLDWARRIVYRHWQKFHAVRRLELKVLLRFLAPVPGEVVLDLGSGKGALSGALARRGVRVFGVDPSAPAVRIATRWVDSGARFVVAAGEDLPLRAASFDKAISVCVLEHTRDDARVLAEVARALKAGGELALTVDSLESPHVSEAFRRHHVLEYRCNQLYDPARIRVLLRGAGFEPLETAALFRSRAAIALLRWGSRFHYRGPFVLLFPLLYPALLAADALDRESDGGMILAIRARKT